MPLGTPNGGFSFSPEYQSSALPWVTSSVASASPTEYDFNYVTRFITVTNPSSGSLSIAFSLNGSNGNNKVLVPGGAVVNLEYRVTKVWIKAEVGLPTYSLAAGLTTIPAGNMPPLTGSFPDGSSWAGVG